jgi:hypothetical protein
MTSRSVLTWLLCTSMAAAAAPACSSSATITRRDQPPITARIESSGAEALHVRTGDGKELHIPRAEVADIDHPGNVLMIAGLSLLALVYISVAPDQASTVELLTSMAVLGSPALGMIAWGGTSYVQSRQAASEFNSETTRLRTPRPDQPYVPPPAWSNPAGAPRPDQPYVPPPAWSNPAGAPHP